MKAIGYDINWIYKLHDVYIHALSGGGCLPKTISDMEQSDYDVLIKKSLSGQEIIEYTLNPFLNGLINVTDEQAQEILSTFHIENLEQPLQQYIERFYARPFIRFASKGFISLDKTNLYDPFDCHYHIVAYPKIYDNEGLLLPKFNKPIGQLLSHSFDLSSVIDFADLM